MKIKGFNRLPKELKSSISWIARCADRRRLSAFIVGGIVRDILLGIKNFDLDIVVEGDGIEFAQALAKKRGAQLTTHGQFGTATITLKSGTKIDIATARKEIYQHPGSLPVVKPGIIADDLFRRDFTINAMAIAINKERLGVLFDYFNGQEDIKRRRIRVLHDLSFIDDPTRIIRAIRFQQRFNFKFDSNTYSLIKEAARDGMLRDTSPTRIWDELVLLLKESKPKKYIVRLSKVCKLSFIHPNLKVDRTILRVFDSFEKSANWFHKRFPKRRKMDTWLAYFILLVHKLKVRDINAIVKKYNIRRSEQLKIYSFLRTRERVLKTLAKTNLKPSQIYSILEPLSYEVIILLKAATKNNMVGKRIDSFLCLYNGVNLKISGSDLIASGITPGKHFKVALGKTLSAKIDGKLKTKKDELSFAKKIIRKK